MKENSRNVVVTGGAGYIGSHVVLKLLNAGYVPIILDNFQNSSPSIVYGLERIAGTEIEVAELDICDRGEVATFFSRNEPIAVIHCAGLKAVGESVSNPILYFEKNVGGTLNLLRHMDEAGCRHIVFSSSATVYGVSGNIPCREDSMTLPCNPYGRSKLFIEEIIRDWCSSGDGRSATLLRYFNPIGADESGLIGEWPKGIPNNLMPLILEVAAGIRKQLSVFGKDYDTPDGTCIRDYIHVDDLARGHIAAMEFTKSERGVEAFNLGTGIGISVLDLISAFSRVTGKEIPHRFAAKRAGDVPVCLADPSRALNVLGWQAELTLDRMCADAWRFYQTIVNGPESYRGLASAD